MQPSINQTAVQAYAKTVFTKGRSTSTGQYSGFSSNSDTNNTLLLHSLYCAAVALGGYNHTGLAMAYNNFNLEFSYLAKTINDTNHIFANGTDATDPYTLAVATLAFGAIGNQTLANHLAMRLAAFQDPTGLIKPNPSIHYQYPLQSPFFSSLDNTKVELQAFAAAAFVLAGPNFASNASNALLALFANYAGADGFGGSISTLLALKAILLSNNTVQLPEDLIN
jgi:hypothetical protein